MNTAAVVEPELTTVHSVFSRSKALIHGSHCSSTAYVLAWLMINMILSSVTVYVLHGDVHTFYGYMPTFALQTLTLVFNFSLWQKLVRST